MRRMNRWTAAPSTPIGRACGAGPGARAPQDVESPWVQRPVDGRRDAVSRAPSDIRHPSRETPTTAHRRGPLAASAIRCQPGRSGRERREFSVAGASVDRAFHPSYAGFMNLRVPPELEAKLTRLAAETGRTVDQVALDLLASSVDHDEWFRQEVEKGRVAAREGRLIDHDEVASRIDRRYRG
jgi:predicted transcriptional regulator